MEAMKEQFLGKEVVVYPGDTNTKFGKVLDINEVGVTFLATNTAGMWKNNTVNFIAFSANLKFAIM